MDTKWLNQTNMSEVELVGGKNASLGEMIQNLSNLNINIPDGFIITANGFDKFINNNNLNKKINSIIKSINVDNTIELKNKSEQIKKLIINSQFPKELKNNIIDYYVQLNKKYNTNHLSVAVRSSGTSEDMPDASFAGQQDTYLNVKGIDDLLEKVKYCFASLYNDRAISYRKAMNYDNKIIKLSVCIQKMVRSDLASSGVVFTLDISSGFKDLIVINSSYGLGEMVVSGQVKPDEFLVYKKKMNSSNIPIIDKIIGNKDKKMVYSDTGTKIVDVSNEDKNKFSLSQEQILQLAEWSMIIENHYSKINNKWCPMDIEWGIDGNDNKLYILQARPETVYSRMDRLKLKEYQIKKNQPNKKVLTGIAIGDSIGYGKVKLIESIDDITLEKPFNQGDILVTKITDPDWEPIMKKASAIVTDKGGRTCHAAIVARELGVTAIVGSLNATQILKNDQMLTVSCCEGDVGIVYEGELEYEVTETDISELPKIKTKLMMNVASPYQAFKFSQIPNHGVGLAREEFIINNYIKVHPMALLKFDEITDEKTRKEIIEITSGYTDMVDYFVKKLSFGIARIASAFYPKDVIVRFSDFKTNEYANLLGGKDYEPHEENPMIGWRGASRYYSKNFKEAFGLECKAVKYVRETIGLDNVIVMIPFCRTLGECDKVLDVMEEFGLKRGENGLKVYLMCEIPSNVILAEEFCQKVDGFSIGSNDLTQLTLGLDRDSELVSDIYDERDQAVKIMLSKVIKVCKQNNTKIGICGQGPSDYPDFAEFLVREGIDTISLTPDSVIKNIKSIAKIESKL
jgi:pyruvate, water dikinase